MGELCVSPPTAPPQRVAQGPPPGEWRCRGPMILQLLRPSESRQCSMILQLMRPNRSQEIALMEEGLTVADLIGLHERHQDCTIQYCQKLSVAKPVVFAGPADQ